MRDVSSLSIVDPRFFMVCVNRAQGLDKMAKTAHFECVNSNITEESFGFLPSAEEEIVALAAINLGEILSAPEVFPILKRHSFRPADIAELVTFVGRYGAPRDGAELVALGSYWAHPDDGERFYTQAHKRNGVLKLDLAWGGHAWYEKALFLAARKLYIR